MDKVLCQNVLECMFLASVNADGALESGTPTSIIAWDYPYSLLEQKQLIKPEIFQGDSLSGTLNIHFNLHVDINVGHFFFSN